MKPYLCTPKEKVDEKATGEPKKRSQMFSVMEGRRRVCSCNQIKIYCHLLYSWMLVLYHRRK